MNICDGYRMAIVGNMPLTEMFKIPSHEDKVNGLESHVLAKLLAKLV